MNKKNNLQQSILKGNLVPFSEVFDAYSEKQQQEILKRARYLKAAMELKKLRRDLKITQEELAKKMHVKREFLARIESGEQNITLETLHRIADATGKEFVFHFV